MNIKNIMQAVKKVGDSFTDPEENWASILLYEVNKQHHASIVSSDPTVNRDDLVREIKDVWLKNKPSFMALILSAYVVRIHKDDPLFNIKMVLCKELGPQYSPSKEENIMIECFDGKESQCCFARVNRFSDKPPTLDKWGKIMKDTNTTKTDSRWLIREAYLLAQGECHAQ